MRRIAGSSRHDRRGGDAPRRRVRRGGGRPLRGPRDLRQRRLPGARRWTSGSRAPTWGPSPSSTSRSRTTRRTRTGSDEPGKAVVVLQIDDPGFQDFREDASCQIFPQSLLGEKFVECEPTQPRAPGTEPPPELEVIPEGERRRGPAPAAARAERQVGRPRPGQQHHARALPGPLPPDPQRPRRRAGRHGATSSRRSSSARTRRCARRTRCSRPSRARTTRSRPSPTDSDAIMTELAAGARAGRVVHQRGDDRRRGHRSRGAPSSRRRSRASPASCASCARR